MVMYEDQDSKSWEELKRVNGNTERVTLHLWPYMSYRFRVSAINDVGRSEPSKPTEIHKTAAQGKRLLTMSFHCRSNRPKKYDAEIVSYNHSSRQ